MLSLIHPPTSTQVNKCQVSSASCNGFYASCCRPLAAGHGAGDRGLDPAPQRGWRGPGLPLVRRAPGPRVERSEGGLRPLYLFARSFLRAVQPNAFPGDLLARVMKNGTADEDVPELVRYEAGYLVCFLLAVFYLLFLPITGAALLWRHRHPRGAAVTPPSPAPPRWNLGDLGAAGALILTTLLLIIGVILAFASNSRTRAGVRPALLHLEVNLGVLEGHLAAVPQEIESVLEQYSIPKAAISRSIEEMDDTVGETIVARLQSPFQEALAAFSTAVGDANRTSETLRSMEEIRVSLKERQIELQYNLTNLKASLENLTEVCPGCETDADYNKSNLTFLSIRQICSRQLAPTIEDLLSELNHTQVLLRNSSQGFPSLLSLRRAVTDLRVSVRRAGGPLDHYDHARWAVGVTLCFVLLVTAVLLLAAVSVGLPLLFNPAVYSRCPHARLERTALWMFQICILLMCAFSWLYIIMVFITLFLGGNVHTLLCQSFTSREIFPFLDKQEDLFTSLLNHSTPIPLKSARIFRGCQRGESLFLSMDMDQTFDLEKFLDPAKYFTGLNETLQDVSVSAEGLKLLSDGGREALLTYQEIDLESYPYDAMTQLLGKPVVKQNLLDLANELKEKAQNETVDTKAALLKAAGRARLLHDQTLLQSADAANMNESVKTLKIISQSYGVNVITTLSRFDATQTLLDRQAPLISANVSRRTLESGEQQLLRYLAWARRTILEDVLGCGWLTRSVDNIYTAVCLNVVDPWNGFWLSLGWCCAFLVPAVFLSLYVTLRLPPHPTAQLQASAAFTGYDDPDISLKKKPYDEKEGESHRSEEKPKSNIYMTLSELGDFND
ncbi:prominin-2-like isoform X2 [Gadus macrocephalus]|uniref:prominin-2-like isoform X2 n=1 Tax=Gadus macrocephalus TaxID=80720 RepID=UPI0028CB494F|nr:prominin-2-like isoform X2 [Gadus macrocephalus]